MSAILPQYTEDQIKIIVTSYLENLFGIEYQPKDVRISEFVIIVLYSDSKNEGMIPHEIQGLYYSNNEAGRIAVVSITNPLILNEYATNNSTLLVEPI